MGGLADSYGDLSSSQVEAVHFLPQKINKYKVEEGSSRVCFLFWFWSSNNPIWLFADPTKFKAWTCRRTSFLSAIVSHILHRPTG